MRSSALFSIMIVFLLSSCTNEKLRQESIQLKIDERIAEFKRKNLASCEQQAMEKAAKKADSILLMNADLWQIRTDLIERPPIPSKPSSPQVKIRVDSSKAVPLFPVTGAQKN